MEWMRQAVACETLFEGGQEKFVAVKGGFECALDLVKHIKAGHGDHFGLCVAGYLKY